MLENLTRSKGCLVLCWMSPVEAWGEQDDAQWAHVLHCPQHAGHFSWDLKKTCNSLKLIFHQIGKSGIKNADTPSMLILTLTNWGKQIQETVPQSPVLYLAGLKTLTLCENWASSQTNWCFLLSDELSCLTLVVAFSIRWLLVLSWTSLIFLGSVVALVNLTICGWLQVSFVTDIYAKLNTWDLRHPYQYFRFSEGSSWLLKGNLTQIRTLMFQLQIFR